VTTSSDAAAVSAPQPRLRRIVSAAFMVVTFVMLAAVAGCALVPSPSLPPSRSVGWRLADGFLGTPRFDPTTAQTTTAIPISVDWLACAPQDASWLLPQPEISYMPESVTITMHTTDAFAATTTCGGGNENKGDIAVMLDVGIPVEVHLREPLGGRALFDGAALFPGPRPYP
jgi:hypothetical protein